MERPQLWRLCTTNSSGSPEVKYSNSRLHVHVHSLYWCSSQMHSLENLDTGLFYLRTFYLFEDNMFTYPLPYLCFPDLEQQLPPIARKQQVEPRQPVLALLANTDKKGKKCLF